MSVRQFQTLLEWDADDKVWVTYVPALDYLPTFGETREQALDNTKEAILGYLEAAAKEGIPVPDSDTETELVTVEVAVA
jgi:predicted RNase H-like HicB family nuclease